MRVVLRCGSLLGLLLTTGYVSAATVPVTSGLVVQFDASNPLGTGALPNGTPLSTWDNVAPVPTLQKNGVLSATIGTNPGNTAPTVSTTEANAPASGLPVVQFNGTTDLLQSTAFTTALAQPDQVFVVWLASNSPGAGEIVFDGLSSGARQSADIETTLSGNVLNQYASGFNFAPYNFSGPIEQSYTYNNASSSFTVNGSTFSSGNPGGNSLDGVTLGGRFQPFSGVPYALNGYIAEVLIYSTPLGATGPDNQTQQVENYLIDKWLTAPVPEPGTGFLALAGSLGLAALAIRRKRRRLA